MVRDKDNIYAEKNDDDTILSYDSLPSGIMLLGNGAKLIKASQLNSGIVFVNNLGIISLSITNEPNKIAYIDSDKNIVWRSIR